MPQRNGQNPIRKEKGPSTQRGKYSNTGFGQAHTSNLLHCPKCQAEVTPTPGFRVKSMKCPKCGSPLVK